MAARKLKRTKRKYRTRSYQTGPSLPEFNFDLELDPAVVREISAILLVGIGIFTLLAILGAAGGLGHIFYAALRLGFGYTSFIFPVLLVVAGVGLFFPQRYNFKIANAIGLILFVISLSTLMHLFVERDVALDVAALGGGGGYLGFFISLFLINILDFWASFLITTVIFAISLLFAFGLPLREIFMRSKFSLPKLPALPEIVVNDTLPKAKRGKMDEEEESDEDLPARKPNASLINTFAKIC